jgi:hypothetical protein
MAAKTCLPTNVENPAREEERRVFNTDQQLGGGGVVGPTEERWEEECVFDDLTIQDACLKNSRNFAPQHCVGRMASHCRSPGK